MSNKAASILGKFAGTDRKRNGTGDAQTLSRHVVRAMLDKKARDIVLIDMRKVSDIADYFLICTGDSDLQIKAIVDGVQDEVREATGERPWRSEGYTHRQWVVVDYVDVVVHVFDQERRSFYNLERLWADAPTENISDDATSVVMLD